MPTDMLWRTLELELEEGEIVFTRGAQRHAYDRHPDDFALAFEHFQQIVTNPLYVGDDLNNVGKIEFVGRVPVEGGLVHILVAVTVELDRQGRYHVVSFYRVSDAKVQGRRKKGFLKLPR